MSVKQIFNTSAELDYPTVLPTLDLDFANSKTLDPRITFTRASGGSYVGADGLIKLAGVNEPRFDHDPYTGESLGFLVEEARTNSLTYSQNFSTGWTPNNVNLTPDAGLAPDGSFTAGLITVNNGYSGTDAHIVHARVVAGGTNNQHISFYLKANGFDTIYFISGSTTYGTYYRKLSDYPSVGNGWYRVSATGFSVPTDPASFYIGVCNLSGSRTATGDGVKGVYIWGVQWETGAFPTSYIPTVASTRTRAADTASITGKNFSSWYNTAQSTILAKLQNINAAGANSIWSFDDGTSSQRIMFRVGFGAMATNFTNISDAAIPYAATHAFAITANSMSGAKNGTLYTAPTGTSVPIVTQLQFGAGPGVNRASGTIARLTYYPVRLPDAQLQVLTS